VLNEIITLEFAHGLVVKKKGVKLNWVAYAFAMHEKCVALQIAREVVKEKKGALPPILKQADVLQVDVLCGGIKSSSLTIGSSISKNAKAIVVIGVGGKQPHGQSSGRSHLPPYGTSRLNALHCLKPVKVELIPLKWVKAESRSLQPSFTSRSMLYNHWQFGSSLPSIVMRTCNPKDMSKVSKLLISKQMCMQGLKEKIEEI
jgi:hypothetical protein